MDKEDLLALVFGVTGVVYLIIDIGIIPNWVFGLSFLFIGYLFMDLGLKKSTSRLFISSIDLLSTKLDLLKERLKLIELKIELKKK